MNPYRHARATYARRQSLLHSDWPYARLRYPLVTKGRVLATVALLVAGAMTSQIYSAWRYAADASCEIVDTTITPSPDNVWEARTSALLCHVHTAADAHWVVSLARTGAPGTSVDVYKLANDDRLTRPRLQWTDRRALLIASWPTHGVVELEQWSNADVSLHYAYRLPQADYAAPAVSSHVLMSLARMNEIIKHVRSDALERQLMQRAHRSLPLSPSVDIQRESAGVAYRYRLADHGQEILVTDPTRYDGATLGTFRTRSGSSCGTSCHTLIFSSTRGTYGT